MCDRDSFSCVSWLCMLAPYLIHRGGTPNIVEVYRENDFLIHLWLTQMWNRVSFSCVSWLILLVSRLVHRGGTPNIVEKKRDMTHSHAWQWLILMCVPCRPLTCDHDSFTCVLWLIHTCAVTHSQGRDAEHSGGMTHSYVCHDSFTCVPWLIRMCARTHSHVCSFTCVSWLIHRGGTPNIVEVEKDMTHLDVWPWLILMCAMTRSHVCRDSCTGGGRLT